MDTDAENNFLSTLGSILAQAGDLCMQKSFDLSGLNYTVNNASHRLLLFVIFGPNPTNSAFVTIGSTTLSYRLQVSPPPDSPTFSDVPAADLAFQYIEALAASGISAGCGGGKFCPDSPVTRRQMAVFLSKALGLSHNFGTTNPTYFTIPEWEFRPQVSSLVYADTGLPNDPDSPPAVRYWVSGRKSRFPPAPSSTLWSSSTVTTRREEARSNCSCRISPCRCSAPSRRRRVRAVLRPPRT